MIACLDTGVVVVFYYKNAFEGFLCIFLSVVEDEPARRFRNEEQQRSLDANNDQRDPKQDPEGV